MFDVYLKNFSSFCPSHVPAEHSHDKLDQWWHVKVKKQAVCHERVDKGFSRDDWVEIYEEETESKLDIAANGCNYEVGANNYEQDSAKETNHRLFSFLNHVTQKWTNRFTIAFQGNVEEKVGEHDHRPAKGKKADQ